MTISYTIRTAADGGEDDLADRIVGLAERGVGDLEQDVLLSVHRLNALISSLVTLAVGPRLDPMHGGDQQFHQRVGDLPLSLLDQRRQQEHRQLARMCAHVGGRLHRCPGPPGGQHLGRHVGEQSGRQFDRARRRQLADLGHHRLQAHVARRGLDQRQQVGVGVVIVLGRRLTCGIVTVTGPSAAARPASSIPTSA
ncbi:hypothetical protein OIE67_05475 [Nonomuraea fuscirosea]|uniref:hypothetical protein n=1 Tax=Nonomuraea fuscirosea TaxID=1291556 RepID=UPI002DDB78D0|nr:hypothetical protein [Nonomuraea fuscirosea]WSA54087.1 hypothetical protein OIE67_05475 [Nonomuraea fuscirosea]